MKKIYSAIKIDVEQYDVENFGFLKHYNNYKPESQTMIKPTKSRPARIGKVAGTDYR